MTQLIIDRRPPFWRLLPPALAAALPLLPACGGRNHSPDATITATARVAGSARYVDRDRDNLVGAGDSVTIRFDRPVRVRQATVAFELAVEGDSFGSGASMEAGDRTDEVRIVLGAGANLRTRGTHQNNSPGSPSGLALGSTSAIFDHALAAPVSADPVRDLAAGFTLQAIPGLADDAEAILAGDLDGDGDLDLVVGRDGAGARVLGNQGGDFADTGQSLGAGTTLARGDVDGDGDLDLVIGSNRVATTSWRNDGSGRFAPLQSLAPVATECVALADLDSDGDLDLVRGNGASDPDEIWWNDGSGTFAAGPTVGEGNTRTITLADVDGDGDIDLLQGRAGPSRIWRNDGAGAFTTGPALGSGNTHAIAVGDLDCDGDLDLVTAGRDPGEVWRNDGGGTFTPTGGLRNAATDAVRLLDVDGDGRLDVYAVNANGQDDEIWTIDASLVLRGSGSSYANGTTTDAAVGDFDRDGDLDVATVGTGEALRLLWSSSSASRGPIRFQAGTTQLGEGAALHLATGDIDADGAADVVACMGDGLATVVWQGDGLAGFPTRRLLANGGHASALGDVDGDGDLDLIDTGPVAGLRLWRNLGGGLGFAGAAESLSAAGGNSVVLHDVDHDGDLDLLLARAEAGPAGLWRNDGTGVFVAAAVPLLPTGAKAASIVDLDRDGDADLLLATALGVILLRNDGTGAFPAAVTIGTAALNTLAVADTDGDGDLDLAVGGESGFAIWRNDGIAGFVTSVAPAGAATRALAFVDIDADGDPDLLRGGSGSDEVWSNALGTFTLTPIDLSTGPTNGFAVADLDCDGDLDVVVADGAAAGGWRIYVRD